MQITDCVGYTEVQNLVLALKEQMAQPESDYNNERCMRQLVITGCRGRRLSSQSGTLLRPCGDSVRIRRNDCIQTDSDRTSIIHKGNNIGHRGEICRDKILISLAYLDMFG